MPKHIFHRSIEDTNHSEIFPNRLLIFEEVIGRVDDGLTARRINCQFLVILYAYIINYLFCLQFTDDRVSLLDVIILVFYDI